VENVVEKRVNAAPAAANMNCAPQNRFLFDFSLILSFQWLKHALMKNFLMDSQNSWSDGARKGQ
jgi:hypothetical protein